MNIFSDPPVVVVFGCCFPFLGFHQCENHGLTGLTEVVIHDWMIPSGKLIPVVQCGGGSFKNRKPIGEVGCCESRMAERSH